MNKNKAKARRNRYAKLRNIKNNLPKEQRGRVRVTQALANKIIK